MYNRYIRNDNGHYDRVVQQDHPPQEAPSSPPPADNETPSFTQSSAAHSEKATRSTASSHASRPSELRFLDKLLSRFHLSDIDSGDLILLILLFFLFHEDGDEELMIALGLLLIL